MVKHLGKHFTTLLCLFLLLPSVASAAVESEVIGNLKLPSAPIDLTVSADGKRLFALLENGVVAIFSSSGKKEGEVRVAKQTDKIEVAPSGDRLFATNSKTNEISITSIQYIANFDVSNSAFKGNPQADIIIASFNDFQ